MKINFNENFKKLSENYLFSEIARRVDAVRREGGERIISLGIGDATLPLSPSVARAMARKSLKMKTDDGFRGYGDTQGEILLREAICRRYANRGVNFCTDEIFISDGAKSDLGNVYDVLGDNESLIITPTYPVYLDASIIAGKRVRLIEANKKNDFLPLPFELPNKPFVICLCSPNNPTGVAYDKKGLKEWVDFALKSGSLIIFDAAYEAYMINGECPHSIFEIEGARECALEVCSFSKMAGFTGVRCGWTAIARENALHSLWKRRQGTKFNGASCISQEGALASLSRNGEQECAQNIEYYMENARILADFFTKKGVFFVGGVHAPYIWAECSDVGSSWQIFDRFLHIAHIACTPGEGFGESGKNFVRFSSFALRKDILEAIERLDKVL